MSELRRDLILTYASILHEERAVTFEHDEAIYRMWESDEGWYIEVLSTDHEFSAVDENGYFGNECWTEVDGGLCTGSAIDAIEFMLPQSQPSYQGGE